MTIRLPLKARASRIVVTCLLCFGFWQFGQGAYIPAKAWVAQELMQRAWRRAENGEDKAAPWPWADTFPIARMSAKGGDIDLIILEGGSGRTLAFAPGHLSASVLPGETGNTIIAGHRDTHFQFLQYMKKGESILLETTEGRKHLYQVTDIDVEDSSFSIQPAVTRSASDTPCHKLFRSPESPSRQQQTCALFFSRVT